MNVILALAVVTWSSAQMDYVYPSNTAAYVPDTTYVVCGSDGCPAPTAKQTVTADIKVQETKKAPSAPITMSLSTILPSSAPVILTQSAVEAGAPQASTKEVVYFAHDSANLSQGEKAKLDGFKQVAAVFRLKIIGYSDDLGTKGYNDKLSLRRAQAVKEYLGLEADVEGEGKCCYVDLSDRAKNRRAEIEIIRNLSRNDLRQEGGK